MGTSSNIISPSGGGGGGTWGTITGSLATQLDLQAALDLKAALASPVFTGTVTLPGATVALGGGFAQFLLAGGAGAFQFGAGPSVQIGSTYGLGIYSGDIFFAGGNKGLGMFASQYYPASRIAGDSLHLGYSLGDAAATNTPGEIRAKTGTTISFATNNPVAYGNYVLSPSENNAGNSGATKTLTLSTGSAQKVTMTANCTFTLASPQAGGAYVLELLQDATGGWTYTWPATVLWPGGSAPTASAANKVDLINLFWNGTNYFGSYSLNYNP